jgi:hypothetical protein
VTQRGLSAPSNAGEREWLLTAKLSVTRLRSDLLHRIRLLDALDEASRRELVLVCAPAGYGETTLLASWADAGPGRSRGGTWTRPTPGEALALGGRGHRGSARTDRRPRAGPAASTPRPWRGSRPVASPARAMTWC